MAVDNQREKPHFRILRRVPAHTPLPTATMRRRPVKNRAQNNPADDEKEATSPTKAAKSEGEGDEPLPSSVASHVWSRAKMLLTVTPIVATPYVLYLLYMFVHLQSGLLRAPVAAHEMRQVLIVGSQSSGTTEAATRLSELGLEVGHEVADTKWHFARDGTVSWMHGLRHLAPLPPEAQAISIMIICQRFWPNFGFHPAMYREPRNGCSYRGKTWSACWAKECREMLAVEWGCAATGTCETPFAKQLLLVRHPLRTIESLQAKFCLESASPSLFKQVDDFMSTKPSDVAQSTYQGGDITTIADALDRPAPRVMSILAQAIFPGPDWPAMGDDTPMPKCLEIVGWYYVLYYEALAASKNIDEVVRIDDSYDEGKKGLACTLARAAGFLDPATAVNPSSHQVAKTACDEAVRQQKEREQSGHYAFPQQRANQINKGRVKVRFADLRATNTDLERRVRALTKKFGYDEE